jgi:hypothetical protein
MLVKQALFILLLVALQIIFSYLDKQWLLGRTFSADSVESHRKLNGVLKLSFLYFSKSVED